MHDFREAYIRKLGNELNSGRLSFWGFIQKRLEVSELPEYGAHTISQLHQFYEEAGTYTTIYLPAAAFRLDYGVVYPESFPVTLYDNLAEMTVYADPVAPYFSTTGVAPQATLGQVFGGMMRTNKITHVLLEKRSARDEIWLRSFDAGLNIKGRQKNQVDLGAYFSQLKPAFSPV
jgi:hypothetical protein